MRYPWCHKARLDVNIVIVNKEPKKNHTSVSSNSDHVTLMTRDDL